ncbi:hypothetical protein niasHT_028153 [Heterodera trifolii]|uniref:ADP/ATP translocase n=1 Tax=Heterodera trifolii TaxID=157864 RepID=A0ABD2JNX5_9BILA
MSEKDVPLAFSGPAKFVSNALAGGTAAVVTKTAIAPIERVKLLLQAQDASAHITADKRYKGIVDVLVRVPKEQGFLAFWRGNFPSIVRYFPSQALNFAFNDLYKGILSKNFSKNRQFLGSFASGAAAGATSSLFTYWLDFARTRLALDIGRSRESREFTGLADLLTKIWRSDGLLGLYRGFSVSIWASIIYRACYFGFFDKAKAYASSDGKRPLSFLERWLIAQGVTMASGMLAYPLDTVRRRLMMQSGHKEHILYKNGRDCARKIFASEHGIAGFYKGGLSNILRSTGGALVLVLYEEIAKFTPN